MTKSGFVERNIRILFPSTRGDLHSRDDAVPRVVYAFPQFYELESHFRRSPALRRSQILHTRSERTPFSAGIGAHLFLYRSVGERGNRIGARACAPLEPGIQSQGAREAFPTPSARRHTRRDRYSLESVFRSDHRIGQLGADDFRTAQVRMGGFAQYGHPVARLGSTYGSGRQ